MTIISQFYGIKISMFYNDHGPPHFHAYYASYHAKISIATGHIIMGRFPIRALRLVQEWTKEHRKDLHRDWQRAIEQKVLKCIEPLD